jgi:hypothetical protein
MDFRNIKALEVQNVGEMHPRIWVSAKTYSKCWSDSNKKTRKITGKVN